MNSDENHDGISKSETAPSLYVGAKIDPTQFMRQGTSITWFGQSCVQIDIGNEGTSLASLCFVHREYAQSAENQLRTGGDLSKIFEVRVLDTLAEFHDEFLCLGLYKEGRLIGFWDVPLIWADGRSLIDSEEIAKPAFQALLKAAEDRARRQPATEEDLLP